MLQLMKNVVWSVMFGLIPRTALTLGIVLAYDYQADGGRYCYGNKMPTFSTVRDVSGAEDDRTDHVFHYLHHTIDVPG